MSGAATREGTRRHAERARARGVPETAYRELGRTGLVTSLLGFGCYRIDDDVPEHRAALDKALREGCNLIDTSTNYGNGGSERLVGDVLKSLFREGALHREEVIVVSKAGYVQGQNLELAREREIAGTPFSDMVKYMDGCWHCIHPEFLSDQLTRSLSRLGLEKLDVFLLHNPEYYFSDAEKRRVNMPLSELRSEFYGRIRRAFSRLEDEVAKGRICAYGVSSNTFGGAPADIETTSITRMWEIAREVGAERFGNPEAHHFSVAQLPVNLFESGPVLERNNGPDDTMTALEYAREKRLAVLVNRPLNAFVGNQLMRLATPEVLSLEVPPADQAKKVAALEAEWARDFAPRVRTGQQGASAADFFRWGEQLATPDIAELPLEHFTQIEQQMVLPQISYLVSQLDTHFSGADASAWRAWRDRYLPELSALLATLRNEGAKRSRKTTQQLGARLDAFLPEAVRGETLSRKALAVLAHTPGVTCVLNGMRAPAYVDDSLGAVKVPPFTAGAELYRAFKLR